MQATCKGLQALSAQSILGGTAASTLSALHWNAHTRLHIRDLTVTNSYMWLTDMCHMSVWLVTACHTERQELHWNAHTRMHTRDMTVTNSYMWLTDTCLEPMTCQCMSYRVAKTHRMPYLYRSFSAKEPYSQCLFCGKMTCNLRHPMGLCHPVLRSKNCTEIDTLARLPGTWLCTHWVTVSLVLPSRYSKVPLESSRRAS